MLFSNDAPTIGTHPRIGLEGATEFQFGQALQRELYTHARVEASGKAETGDLPRANARPWS